MIILHFHTSAFITNGNIEMEWFVTVSPRPQLSRNNLSRLKHADAQFISCSVLQSCVYNQTGSCIFEM